MKLRAIGLALVLASCGADTDAAVIELVPASEAAESVQGGEVVVLDVRTPEEFAAGHIEGAINIDFYAADFSAQLAELSRNVDYVMYCRSGNRSAETARIMDGLDFTSVAEIDGGILSWVEEGFPVVLP